MIKRLTPRGLLLAASCLGITGMALAENTAQLTVDLTQPGLAISEDLFGIFFEDLNYAADGGLYAELVQNRSFEYSSADRKEWNALTSWELVTRDGGKGSVAVEADQPLHANNAHYAVLTVEGSTGEVGLSNAGYDGIVLKAGEKYDVSLFARAITGSFAPKVRLESKTGQVYAEATLPKVTRDWAKYTATLEASADDADARLVVIASGNTSGGKLALDMISLFPRNTFHNRSNGLRADLAQVIADLEPKFMRFPGGCLVHGDGLNNMYRWKDTIGPVEQRKGQPNIWNYHQSVGLGYFEYFQFCEDIGAKPLPVVPAGVCCQNTGAKITGKWGQGQQGLPLSEMDAYIQDVLDLIEWANGPVTSKWGAKRAAAGHPEPFNLEYLGIGNEDHITPVFRERFEMIHKAVKARHPEITLIGTVGPSPAGFDYDEGWKIANQMQLEMVDEHYYQSPGWFLQNLGFYDRYDRSKSKVYLGEYAAHDDRRRTTLRSALAEAAYMTSLERNGDVVSMASYAPLLGKIGRTQWNPNLIYFTNTEIAPTINYHVQQMFGVHAGDRYLASELVVPSVAQTPKDQGVFLGTWLTQAQFDEVRVTAGDDTVIAQSFDDPAQAPQGESGAWRVAGGVIEQSSNDSPAVLRLGAAPADASSYTITLRAKKTGGREGFLIGFGAADAQNYYWWNIAGWGNTQHAVEKSINGAKQFVGRAERGGIEAGRWYDIKIVVTSADGRTRIKCYLDGQPTHDVIDDGAGDPVEVVASAVRDSASGDLILKLVNVGPNARSLHVNLPGASSLAPTGTKTVLAGDPLAVNEMGRAPAVLPQTATISVGPSFDDELPPHSLTVIRIKTGAAATAR